MINAIGTDLVGPSFWAELQAAGVTAPVTFAVGGTFEDLHWTEGTDEQKQAVATVFAAHDPRNADPEAAYALAVAAGLTIASTGTPALNGIYGCEPKDTANINVGQTAVLTKAFWGFYNRIDGTAVEMTPDQFTAVAVAIMGYVVALKVALAAALRPGGKWIAPSATAAIA